MSEPVNLKCPVCGVKFRGVTECPRCRTDLSLPMSVAARAFAARTHAREALLRGDLQSSLRWTAAATRLHHEETN